MEPVRMTHIVHLMPYSDLCMMLRPVKHLICSLETPKRALLQTVKTQMNNVAFHQDLHCLQRQTRSAIVICDPILNVYTNDHPDLTVSTLMEFGIWSPKGKESNITGQVGACNQKTIFLILNKTYVVCTQKNRLNETALLSAHNLCLN